MCEGVKKGWHDELEKVMSQGQCLRCRQLLILLFYRSVFLYLCGCVFECFCIHVALCVCECLCICVVVCVNASVSVCLCV